jgi:two-component system CheB/CheR fusion protein
VSDEAREDGRAVDDASNDPAFVRLLEKLRTEHNFDFREYKHMSLARRIRARLQQVRVESFEAYLIYLDRHADEHVALFNTILINVTGFLRDPDAWKVFAGDVIPRLIDDAADTRSLRLWSAGCSSGEEAYTLAMLIADHLGDRARDFNVKIYATDVDEEALGVARHGLYRLDDLRELPSEMVENHFTREGQTYRFRRDLRRWCIFGRHNVARDPPLSHVDALVCRNVLIYFTAELQERILARFHYAVRERGFLFLGRSESLLARSRWFTPYHVKWRIFQRTTAPAPTVAAAIQRSISEPTAQISAAARAGDPDATLARLQRLIEALPSPSIFIDAADTVLVWNPAADAFFDIPASHAVGRKFRDLDVSYRVEGLRAQIEAVKSSHIPARLEHVAFTRRSGETVHAEIAIVPIVESNRVTAVAVYGIDATESSKLKEQISRLAEQHATAIEELQSTNEELETTNEELQSTNEELETTNEELQSTNEELETTVEELQAANSELGNLNSEMERRSSETRRFEEYQRAVLSSLPSPVIVLDASGIITTWNAAAQRLWGIEPDHVLNRPFWTLPVGDLGQKMRDALDRVRTTGIAETIAGTFSVPGSGRRDLTIEVTPLSIPGGPVTGVVGVVVSNDPRA